MPRLPATQNGVDNLHDKDLEHALIGSILTRPDLIPTVLEQGLERGDFYYDDHRHAWDAAVSMQLAGAQVDASSVAAELAGWGIDRGEAWRITIDAVSDGLGGRVAVNAPQYAAQLRQLGVQRRARHAALQLLEDLGSPTARVAVARSLDELAHPHPNGNRLIGRMSLGALRDLHFPLEDQVCGGLVVKGYRTVIAGYVGEGKSTLTHQLTAALAARKPFLGWQPNRARVLVIDVEQGLASIQMKARQSGLLELADDPDVEVELISEPNGFAIDEDASEAARIRATILDYAPDVVVIDPLYKLFGGSENDLDRIARVVDTLDAWKHELHVALIIPMHTNKPPVEMRGALKPRVLTLPDIASHSRMTRDAQVVLGLQRVKPGISWLSILKDRDGLLPYQSGSYRVLEFDGRTYSVASDEDEEGDAAEGYGARLDPAEAVRRALERHGPLTVGELVEHGCAGSADTIHRALRRLGELVEKTGHRGPWRLVGDRLGDDPDDPENVF